MPKNYTRLTTPLVRDGMVDGDRTTGTLRPATWDEALDRTADGLRGGGGRARPDDIRALQLLEGDQRGQLRGPEVQPDGPRQQQHRQLQPHLTRAICRRSGDRVRCWWRHKLISKRLKNTDLIVLWGSNARETHPIFFHHLLKGVHNGARLYAVDPRRTGSAEWADVLAGPRRRVGHRPGQRRSGARSSPPASRTREFIDRATSGFEAYKAKVESYTLEYAEQRDRRPGRRHPRAGPRVRDRPTRR